QVPRLGGLSALDDQAAAGMIMWVPGSMAFLGPLFWIGTRLLYGEQPVRRTQYLVPSTQPSVLSTQYSVLSTGYSAPQADKRIPLTLVAPQGARLSPGFDLVRFPLLG